MVTSMCHTHTMCTIADRVQDTRTNNFLGGTSFSVGLLASSGNLQHVRVVTHTRHTRCAHSPSLVIHTIVHIARIQRTHKHSSFEKGVGEGCIQWSYSHCALLCELLMYCWLKNLYVFFVHFSLVLAVGVFVIGLFWLLRARVCGATRTATGAVLGLAAAAIAETFGAATRIYVDTISKDKQSRYARTIWHAHDPCRVIWTKKSEL